MGCNKKPRIYLFFPSDSDNKLMCIKVANGDRKSRVSREIRNSGECVYVKNGSKNTVQ